ncbi:MAG TPA: thioredoxin domain-containing protein [Rhodanobacteraceae bacterium]|nr:thioredoxin domain-containing protein [Rhodanobacteraceae bacterium]
MSNDDFARNRLAAASSPYLRQHAGNPVNWQPWDDAALVHARATDTPILLSIGYSACHWCHVMAHECFENPGIAAAMNRAFVNIKLDREERPDIDRVFQLAHHALSGRGGGWPLTAFLDPQDLSPFYIGTYFPPAPRHGLPGFPEVLQRVREYFDSRRSELRAQAGQLRDWLQHARADSSGQTNESATVRTAALQRIATRFDDQHGGNEGAPKFPRASELEWLLDTGGANPRATRMAHLTLANMAARGLRDHLGGGFFRYCVDADWTIPHFEKMLYDNAQLLPVYARAASAPGTDSALRDQATTAAQGIVDWLARDMPAPGGTFFSSRDADSEHEEGKYYLWTRDEVHAALDDADFKLAEAAFGLDGPPNFEGRAWHLLRAVPVRSLADRFTLAPTEITARLDAIRRRLLDARATRVPPARDDKILTAWNALAISGLARCARLLDNTRCAGMARRALAGLREAVWIDEQLYANAAEPSWRIAGFLDDHAFLLDALIETLQLAFDPRDLGWAITLADALLDRFDNETSGAFRFSTPQHATPLTHNENWMDDALPNGSAMAIRSLLRLGHLTGDVRYLDRASRALQAAAGALNRYPDACPTLLRALDESVHPRPQIVVRCPAARAADWQAATHSALRGAGLMPGGDPVDAFLIPADVPHLPGVLAARASHDDGAAYVCSGLTCQAPVTSPDALADALRAALAN